MVRNTLSTKLTLTKNLQSPYIAIHHLLLCLSLGVRYDCSILCYICMCVCEVFWICLLRSICLNHPVFPKKERCHHARWAIHHRHSQTQHRNQLVENIWPTLFNKVQISFNISKYFAWVSKDYRKGFTILFYILYIYLYFKYLSIIQLFIYYFSTFHIFFQ